MSFGGRLVTRQADGAGYHMNTDCDGVSQHDVLTCPHCQSVIFLQTWRKEREQGGGGYCRKCSEPVCGPCLTLMVKHGCQPFMKAVERAVEDNYRIQQNRKVMII